MPVPLKAKRLAVGEAQYSTKILDRTGNANQIKKIWGNQTRNKRAEGFLVAQPVTFGQGAWTVKMQALTMVPAVALGEEFLKIGQVFLDSSLAVYAGPCGGIRTHTLLHRDHRSATKDHTAKLIAEAIYLLMVGSLAEFLSQFEKFLLFAFFRPDSLADGFVCGSHNTNMHQNGRIR